jgi:hypothetical protein
MERVRATGCVVVMAICGAVLALPALAAAATISGTVTAPGGGGIGGVEVCPTPEPYNFEVPCTETNAGGGYELSALPGSAYRLRFSAARNNLNYVSQFYDGKLYYPGDLVTVGDSEARTGVDAVLQPGGSIAGRVVGANSLNPVAGFQVCAFSNSMSGEVGRCWSTDDSGNYVINGLPPAKYQVEFVGEGDFNYLTQYYDGVTGSGVATLVTVAAANEVVPAIDAALQPGAEISGTVTEVGTHQPLAKIAVSLLEPGTERVVRYVETDAAGHYAFRGRPAGSYVVAFSHTLFGSWNGDCYSAQYYKGASSFGTATPLTVAPPQVVTGIDGEVARECAEPRPTPVQVELIPTPQPLVTPRKCRKGFHKKRVKGMVRCVRKHKKHRGQGQGRRGGR